MLEKYRDAISEIFEAKPVRMILYGSYARGDFHVDSDVDIMILADIASEKVSCFADKVYDVTYDFELKYNLEINPNVQSEQIYNQWKSTYPFFINIEREGVIV